jgi:hypothetical protein
MNRHFEIPHPRYHHGPTAFLVMVAIVVPVPVAFARLFAAVFEQPFLRQGRGAGFRRASVA